MTFVPGDKWVYDFSYDFSGIADGYGLRSMRSHSILVSREFLYGHRPGKAVWSLCEDRTEIMQMPVQLPCSLRREIARRSCGLRTETAPYNHRTIFLAQRISKILRFPEDQRAASARCSYGMSTGYGFTFFSNLSQVFTKQNRAGYAPSPRIRTEIVRPPLAFARRRHDKGATGSLRAA